MGGASATLQIILSLVDNASAALASSAEKWKSVGETMTSVGSALSLEVTAPIVGIGYAATTAATQFEAAMTQLVTQAGLPADRLQSLTDAVLAFANSGAQQTPEILAQGLYHIVSLGVPAADAMNVLKDASEGAAIGGANLEDVANALGAAVASNIKGSSDYNQAMAILNATVGAGNMRMEDLATSLGNVLPQATTAGLSLTDVGAAMATMTDNGMPAADAATRLHMAISLMMAPTGQAQKALESINMTQFQLADDMRTKGLLPALQDLQDHLKASGDTADQQAAVLSEAFGGGRSAGAIELLLNNLDRVGQKYDLIDASVNKFGTDVAQQAQTSAAVFAAGTAKMQAASIKLGDALKGPVGTALIVIADGVSKLAEGFAALPKPIQYGVLAVLALVAAVGPLLLIFGMLITTIGTVAAAIGIGVAALFWWVAVIALAIAAVVAIAVAVYDNWDKIKAWTRELGTTISKLWTDTWSGIAAFFDNIWIGLKAAIQDAITFIEGLLGGLFSYVSSITSKILAPIQAVTSVLGGSLNSLTAGGGGATPIKYFASGGIVTGPTLAMVGEAGPEAIIPLSAFNGGGSLAGAGGFAGGGGNIVININGGNYLDSGGATLIANTIGKQIMQQLRLKNFN